MAAVLERCCPCNFARWQLMALELQSVTGQKSSERACAGRASTALPPLHPLVSLILSSSFLCGDVPLSFPSSSLHSLHFPPLLTLSLIFFTQHLLTCHLLSSLYFSPLPSTPSSSLSNLFYFSFSLHPFSSIHFFHLVDFLSLLFLLFFIFFLSLFSLYLFISSSLLFP